MANGTRFSNVDLSCLMSSTFSKISIFVYVTVCIATIFGNSLVLISIYKYPITFKGSLYMFTGNLAVADLLLGLWLLVFIYEEIAPEVQDVWYFCVAKPIGVHISYCCSIFTLLGISFDRFMAVIFPLEHLIKTHQRRGLIIAYFAVIWIVSILFGCLPNILSNLGTHKSTFVCRISVIMNSDFELVCSTALLLFIIITLTLYGIIMWKIKTKETPGNCSSRKQSNRTCLMIIVSVLFLVCWLPHIICSFLMQAALVPSTFQNVVCTREYLARFGFLNSALNWIIYGFANRKFRTAFNKLLCCTFIWKHYFKRHGVKQNRRVKRLEAVEIQTGTS